MDINASQTLDILRLIVSQEHLELAEERALQDAMIYLETLQANPMETLMKLYQESIEFGFGSSEFLNMVKDRYESLDPSQRALVDQHVEQLAQVMLEHIFAQHPRIARLVDEYNLKKDQMVH